jgi:HAD superfamily hydrolase (TIGR01509 family)
LIRAVLFDAGNTLIRMDYEAIAVELRRHGAPVTADDVQHAEWRARVRLDTDVFAPAAVFSTESRDTASRYVRYLLEGVGLTAPDVIEAVTEWRRGYNPPVGLWTVAEPDAAEALALVRASGRIAGVVSNSNGTIRGILDGLGLSRYLHFVLDSQEEGLEKPDPRLFARALARAGVTGEEAAFIGDFYSVDVLGARRAGLRAILMDPGGCWGSRDCEAAPTVLDAVRRLLSD